jgi:adenine-specific DNA-methyltransferase
MKSSSFDSAKLRGGYYSSSDVAQMLTVWAIRTRSDSVIEPSCGDGVFLEAAVARLGQLGASDRKMREQIVGIELDPIEARKASSRVSGKLGDAGRHCVESGDFFDWMSANEALRFDCAVGNPPFIRYQKFPEPSRAKAMAMLERSGLKANRLTNIWVPFVVGVTRLLRKGGRLAMVLPAELLQVTYAAQLRTFLARNFRSLNIVACNEMFFENAEQEVVLLLADGKYEAEQESKQSRIDLRAFSTVSEVTALGAQVVRGAREHKVLDHSSEKWLKYFLEKDEIELMRRLRQSPRVTTLSTYATIDVGVVTGDNSFFVLSKADATRWRLADYTVPLIGRSAHLKGASIGQQEWLSLADENQRVLLLAITKSHNGSLSHDAKTYIAVGERNNVDKGYKCSIRDPWYCVPAVWNPDAFFFRQIYDFPRVVLNRCGATSTDTVHRMRCKIDSTTLIRNLYTHLTAASAEIEGRSYGGGVLELEPTEAERLLVPLACRQGMPLSEIDHLVRRGLIEKVLEENDKLILREGIGLERSDCQKLKNIWSKMRNRRRNRGRNTGGVNRGEGDRHNGQGILLALAPQSRRS